MARRMPGMTRWAPAPERWAWRAERPPRARLVRGWSAASVSAICRLLRGSPPSGRRGIVAPACGPLEWPSLAEAAAALLERPDRAQEIDLAQGRPEHVGEVEFAIGALPQEKPGEPDLAARADDQVGIRQVRRVEVAADPV